MIFFLYFNRVSIEPFIIVSGYIISTCKKIRSIGSSEIESSDQIMTRRLIRIRCVSRRNELVLRDIIYKIRIIQNRCDKYRSDSDTSSIIPLAFTNLNNFEVNFV